jgi:hypothetical protein
MKVSVESPLTLTNLETITSIGAPSLGATDSVGSAPAVTITTFVSVTTAAAGAPKTWEARAKNGKTYEYLIVMKECFCCLGFRKNGLVYNQGENASEYF